MDDLEPGSTFGAYTIEGLIAGGGMGAVYAARHALYGTSCALKVLRSDLNTDDTWRRRFHAEGLAGVSLKHPNVLAARDVVIDDSGRIALVLDLVREGLTLHRVISREFPDGLSLVDALRVQLGLIQGIEYAHDKDIIHGDLKPENVLIQGDFRDPTTWVPQITDFGTVGILAHPVMVDGLPAVVMSPRYASPEHLRGIAALERRSDLYSLGLLLHYLVTGQHASTARSVEEAATNVAKAPPVDLLVDQPAALVAVFQRATAARAEDRFQTARDFALAVRDLLDQLGAGVALEDLQADLATEIIEERRKAARQKRIEARKAAEAAEQADEGGAGDALDELEDVDLPDDVGIPDAPDAPTSDAAATDPAPSDAAPTDAAATEAAAPTDAAATGAAADTASATAAAPSGAPSDAAPPSAVADPIAPELTDAGAAAAALDESEASDVGEEPSILAARVTAPEAAEDPDTAPTDTRAPGPAAPMAAPALDASAALPPDPSAAPSAAPAPTSPTTPSPPAVPSDPTPAPSTGGGVPVMVFVAVGVVVLIIVAILVMNPMG
jgi:hypothetical protein